MSIKLTQREHDILTCLEQAAGQIVSRRALAKAVLGLDFSESNVLDVHIKNIRRKLGKETVISVRGLGYRSPAPRA